MGEGHGLSITTTGLTPHPPPVPASTSSTTHSVGTASSSGGPQVTSPRNDFFVSQRAADFEQSRVDSLSLEEQEIMATIQELQLQLMQLRAEQESDSDDEPPMAAASNPATPNAPASQLIVVSNNLPVLLERVPQTGRWRATKTTGGLDKLMCLTGVRSDLNFLWVGWVGQHIPKHEHESVRRLLLQHNCLPVFLSSEVANRHNGFSSEVLWSLFHYVAEPVGGGGPYPHQQSAKRFNKADWRAYESANESFADAIAEIYNEGDAVWIHDYHLMLLPSLLRQRIPRCYIGWFLHTPFPASDVYCRLPVRAELLRGVLRADLVGFQTFDYERHFVSTCLRLLGVECSHKGIRSSSSSSGDRDHFTSIGVYPIGINIEPFARAASSIPTLHRVNELHRKFGTKRIILGVDRIDNIKGIPHKLLAMELLLNRYPEWQHNVVLILIGLSSRSGVVDNLGLGGGGGSGGSGSSTNATATPAATASATAATATATTTLANAPPIVVVGHPNTTANPTTTAAPSPPTLPPPDSTMLATGGASVDHESHLDSPPMPTAPGRSISTPVLPSTPVPPGISPTTMASGTLRTISDAGPPTTTTSTGTTTAAVAAAATAGSSLSYDPSHQLETSSQSYRNLLTQVNQLVGRINGTFGTLDYSPIHFIHQRVMQHEELCALYDLADVCLVTSTRDGMNLVSHEFVVCQQHFMRRNEERKRAARASAHRLDDLRQQDPTAAGASSPQISPTKILTEWEGEEGGPGVLILSEFAGCSQSLSGAIVTNPWNTEDVALSIHQALGMCRAEREIRQQKLYRYVSANTATAWSMQFLTDLKDAVLQNKAGSTQLPRLDVKNIVSAYRKARNRVIILDYDRTLTPQHAPLPLAAVGPNFKSLLDTLSADEANTVFIVSARERKFLETWLQGVRVGVAAEDGFFYRMNLSNDREVWKTMSKFQYDSAAARGGGWGNGASASVSSSTDSLYEPSFSSHNSRRSMSLGSIPSYAGGGYLPTSTAPYPPGGPTTASSASGSGALFAVDTELGDSSWKDLVLPTMINFTDRTPGSSIEDKESSLTWHYGDADPHFGAWQAKDLQIVLERQLLGSGLEVYHGQDWVSVEHEGCTKAKVLEGILKHLSLPAQIARKGHHEVDFVLCVCDDLTDDQMFQTLDTLRVESDERHEKRKEAALKAAAGKRLSAPAIRPRAQTQEFHTRGAGSTPRSSQRPTTSRSKSVSGGGNATGSIGGAAPRKHSSASVGSADSSTGSTTGSTGATGAEATTKATATRRKSDKPSRRRKGRTSGRNNRELGRLVEEDDELEQALRVVDEDNKVAFSRLHKVPVQLAEGVSIFTVVVGSDVQHSAGRHTNAYAVDSLGDVRKVLKEFAEVGRPPKAPVGGSSGNPTTTTPTTTTPTETDASVSVEATEGNDSSNSGDNLPPVSGDDDKVLPPPPPPSRRVSES